MILASIQRIREVVKHSNADALDIVTVLNYKAIVKRDQYKVGDLIVFIEPDSVLPDAEWAKEYKAKSNRVRAVKLRGEWSEGIIESFHNVGYDGPIESGLDITAFLGILKYDPPAPQDLSAKGLLPFGIPKTDECRWESMKELPFGERVDILQKIDGKSSSYYRYLDENEQVHEGCLGRTLEYKTDTFNDYTQNQSNYDILNKLSYFCRNNDLRGICVRGESYGKGIQKGEYNPHSKLPLSWAMFSVYLIDKHCYTRKGDSFYFLNIANELRLPTVPVIERDVILTPELIKKYAEMEKLNGDFFEGVVVQYTGGSFKIINRYFDSRK